MLAIADGQDWMIAVTGIFETALGSGTIRLIAPYAGFETLEAKIATNPACWADAGGYGLDRRHRIADRDDAGGAALRARARRWCRSAMFQSLKPGDVLPVSLWPDAVAVSGEVDLFRADYGQETVTSVAA